MTLKETFQRAQSGGFALGAFNVSTLEQIRAIVAAVDALKSPVILEVSPGEAEFLGIETLAAVRDSLVANHVNSPNPAKEKRQALRNFSEPASGELAGSFPSGSIFLNLDHARDLESIKRALEAGFDMVHFDGSELSFAENIERTREVVETAHREGALVEGEIDRAGGHSVLKSEIGDKVLTDPEKAAQFVSETGVDILACFFGNLHGVYGEELALDLGHLAKIKKSVESVPKSVQSVFFSMHGGSGVKEEDVREAVKGGIVKVNVNTELRLAWSEALRDSLAKNPEEIVPYKVLIPVVEQVQEVVENKIKLLGFSDK